MLVSSLSLYTLQMGHLLTLTLWTHSAHMAVCPHGWKEISHGPSQRKQLGPVTDSTSLSSLLLESPPDTETSGGVASLPVVGVVLSSAHVTLFSKDLAVVLGFYKLQTYMHAKNISVQNGYISNLSMEVTSDRRMSG